MKKFFYVLMAVLLALPLFGSPVLAEDTAGNVEKHEVKIEDFELDGFGSFVSFFSGPAFLTFENGDIYLEFSHSGIEHLLSVDIINGNEVEVLSESKEDDLRTYKVKVDGELTEPLNFKSTLTYDMNKIYTGTMALNKDDVHEFLDSIVVEENPDGDTEGESGEGNENVSKDNNGNGDSSNNDSGDNNGSSETPVNEDDTEENNEDNGKSEEKQIEDKDKNELLTPDKAYKIDYILKHEDEERPSAADRFFQKPGVLLEKDGEYYLQLKVTEKEYILEVRNEFGELVMVEEGEDYYILQLKLDGELTETFNIDFSLFYGDHSARLVLDSTNMVEVDAQDHELVPSNNGNGPNIEGEKPVEEPKTPQQPVPTPSQPSSGVNGDGKAAKQPKKEDLLKSDKTYEIDYIVKHEIKDEPSAADSFFVKPGILLEKGSEYYFQFRLNGKQYVNSIKNKFGELVVVYEGNDYVIYQLKVDGKLTDPIFIDFLLTVPGVYDNQEHTARIFLDPSSMKEVDASQYQLVPSTNNNGPDAPGAQNPDRKSNLDPNTPEKPVLGDDNDSGDDKTTAGKTVDNNLNPDTGEETNVLLYVLLLIGSAIPLAIKAKRRFA